MANRLIRQYRQQYVGDVRKPPGLAGDCPTASRHKRPLMKIRGLLLLLHAMSAIQLLTRTP